MLVDNDYDIYKLILNYENRDIKTSSYNKVLKKLTSSNKIFENEKINDFYLENIKANIKDIQTIFNNGGFINIHKSLNPILNGGIIQVNTENNDSDYIKIDISNINEYKENLVNFIIINTIKYPMLEIRSFDLENQYLLDIYEKKNELIEKYLINFKMLSGGFDNLLRNQSFDLEKTIEDLKVWENYMIYSFSIEFNNAIKSSQSVFPNIMDYLNEQELVIVGFKKYYSKYIYNKRKNAKDNDVLVSHIFEGLSFLGMCMKEKETFVLDMPIKHGSLISIMNMVMVLSDNKKNNTLNLSKEFIDTIKERCYLMYEEFYNPEEKFYGLFSNISKEYLVNLYEKNNKIDDFLTTRSVDDNFNQKIYQLKDFAKRTCTNFFEQMLDMEIIYKDFKIKNNKKEIFLKYPKNIPDKDVEILMLKFIDKLFELRKDKSLFSYSKNDLRKITEDFWKKFLREIILLQEIKNEKSFKEITIKKKI